MSNENSKRKYPWLPQSPSASALYGMVIGAVEAAAYYVWFGEEPPLWLTVVGVGIVILPVVIWSDAKRDESDE